MALIRTDIDRIAHLARLELADDESERMLTQLNGFFEIVEAMRGVDTAGIQPLAHPMAAVADVQLRLREDRVLENGIRLVLLSHNTKMGAAKGAVLVAEYLVHRGLA